MVGEPLCFSRLQRRSTADFYLLNSNDLSFKFELYTFIAVVVVRADWKLDLGNNKL